MCEHSHIDSCVLLWFWFCFVDESKSARPVCERVCFAAQLILNVLVSVLGNGSVGEKESR